MMTTEDDRVTVAERYMNATISSHLEVREGRGAVDYLIAAGYLRDGLGATLLRLRAEYDTARALLRHTGAPAVEEHLATLDVLQNIEAAWHGMAALALEANARGAFDVDEPVARAIAARVLDAWLDPNCRPCQGRGFNGGRHRGERVMRCGGCQGTGKRRTTLGDSAVEKRLAGVVYDAMEGMLHGAADEMRRLLRAGT